MFTASKNNFRCSGPKHLTSIDWNYANHRMSVAACLVQGAYALEADRQARHLGFQSDLAHPWWENFHFKLHDEPLVDNDESIFGAIFEYKPPAKHHHRSIDRSPRYVIAFRGTLPEPESIKRDLELDSSIFRQKLDQTPRFEIAMNAVQGKVATVGVSGVWLAGHSLGAAIAMLVGKTMAKRSKIFLEAYLFNPPYTSFPIEKIVRGKGVRIGFRCVATLIKVLVAATTSDIDDDSFAAISGWIPCLFVNREDPICCEYIGYFNHRKMLEDSGEGGRAIARMTASMSLGHQVMGSMKMLKKENSTEPIYLLPSANLIENLNPSHPHRLSQWWSTHPNLRSNVYKYT